MNEIIKLIELNEIDKAIELILSKENEYKSDSEYWGIRGYVATTLYDYVAAKECFEEAVRLDSKDCEMFYNFGFVCEQLGYKSDAARYYALSCFYGIDKTLAKELHEKYSGNSYVCKIFKASIKNAENITDDIYCLIDLFDSTESGEVFYKKLMNCMPNIKYICSDKYDNYGRLQKMTIQELQKNNNVKPIVVWLKDSYWKQVRYLAENNIKSCCIAASKIDYFELVHLVEEEMCKIKDKEYLETISICRRHASDGNIDAVLRYVPENMKHYKFNHVSWDNRFDLDNIVKVPLLSSVTIDGFGVFARYPKYEHITTIDLWHAGLGVKAIGLLDVKDPNPYSWSDIFKNVDYFCVPSEMSRTLYTALLAIPVHKYVITGLARNDMLIQSDAKSNLETLLGVSLKDKKVIYNLPTFHYNENVNRIEGSEELQDNFKVQNFNYEEFDKFLEENNAICISKPHYAEEKLVSSKNTERKYKNTYFISNSDLDKYDMNMYDVLAAGDLLITDYSSVAGDFIFMDKPIVYLTADIEEYRETKGFTLEPFEFWNPGYMVKTQEELQSAVKEGLSNPSVHKLDRQRLMPVYFKHTEFGSTYRVWEVIDNAFKTLAEKYNK